LFYRRFANPGFGKISLCISPHRLGHHQLSKEGVRVPRGAPSAPPWCGSVPGTDGTRGVAAGLGLRHPPPPRSRPLHLAGRPDPPQGLFRTNFADGSAFPPIFGTFVLHTVLALGYTPPPGKLSPPESCHGLLLLSGGPVRPKFHFEFVTGSCPAEVVRLQIPRCGGGVRHRVSSTFFKE